MSDVVKQDFEFGFGVETIDYSREVVQKLVESGKKKEAKEYILKYFIRLGSPIGNFKWCPNEKSFKFIKNKDMIQFIHNSLYYKKKKINLLRWYHQTNKLYNQVVDVFKPLHYCLKGTNYINTFPGFLHKENKKFSDFPEDIQNKVFKVWDHIKNIWCSKNNKSFDYIQKWISGAVTGKKMKTGLYLKGPQGLGKSCITEFIQKHVLGQQLVYITNDHKCVTEKFNSQLINKLMLVLEELPVISKNQWLSMGNRLKHPITSPTLDIEGKYKESVEVTNYLNVILISNNNAIALENSDRRFVVLDLSYDMIGNKKYFDILYESLNNKTVGEAFFYYCKEISNKNNNWKEYPPVDTTSKTELIINNLHSVYKFIKDTCLLTKKGIVKQKVKQFYDKYESYCEKNKIDKIVYRDFKNKIRELNINYFPGPKNYNYYECDFKTLYNIYNQKCFIDVLDEFIDEEKEKELEESTNYILGNDDEEPTGPIQDDESSSVNRKNLASSGDDEPPKKYIKDMTINELSELLNKFKAKTIEQCIQELKKIEIDKIGKKITNRCNHLLENDDDPKEINPDELEFIDDNDDKKEEGIIVSTQKEIILDFD